MDRKALNFRERVAISAMRTVIEQSNNMSGWPDPDRTADLAWGYANALAAKRPREDQAESAASAPSWTATDAEAAFAEGWGLFDNSEYGLEIERIDDRDSTGLPAVGGEPEFASDTDAIAHVYVKAKASPLHRKALLLTIGDLAAL